MQTKVQNVQRSADAAATVARSALNPRVTGPAVQFLILGPNGPKV